MLNRIKIRNFKCFDSLSLRIGSLTLLSGFNASGKSTALQSLLLLSQSLRTASRTAKLQLNGCLVHLGTPGEVLHAGSGDVVFCIENESVSVEWVLQAENRTEGIAMQIQQITITDNEGAKDFTDIDDIQLLLPSDASHAALQLLKGLKETVFISAVRTGTADVFPSPKDPSIVYADVGVKGEYAPWWFHKFLDEDIDPIRCHNSEPAKILRRQFNAWANELFPGAQGNVEIIEKTNLLRLELRIGDTGDWRRPSNIGYGLTYAIPVIIAGLLAKPGQVLIIDSPEAHLHPLGQSKMGGFLAHIAAAGVQVVIETHSDHILNGVRLAVRDNVVSPDQTAIYFFRYPTTDSSRVMAPLIDKEGNLSEWPDGFFDQSEKDMAILAGWN